MPNLTFTLEADLLKSARGLALERDTSVNQRVREFLACEVETEQQFAARVAEFKSFFGKFVVDCGRS